MLKQLSLSCECAKVRGNVFIDRAASFHVHCLCCDCQRFAQFLGKPDKLLDEYGGSELLQTYPAYLTITQGEDEIACVQNSENGIYRWYTRCCNTPLANTMRSARAPFVGISVKALHFDDETRKSDVLGPVVLKAFGKHAIKETPPDIHQRFPKTFLPSILWFMAKGFILNKYQPSPFFKDGKPIKESEVLSANKST